MIDVISLATIGFTFFVIAASPGPATISNATIAMSKGRKTSLVYGAGLSSGLLVWGLVAVSGMGVILQSSVYLLSALKILGGLYLIWLAYQSYKTSLQATALADQQEIQQLSAKKWFLRGLLLNTSNPKTVIAWMAALSVGMGESSDFGALLAGLLVCMLAGFTVNALYSLLFSVPHIMLLYRKVSHWVDRIAAGLFAMAGLGLIRSAFQRS